MESKAQNSFGILRWVGKTATTMVVLFVVSFLTPGFSIRGLWSFFLAALVISALDYLAERILKVEASPFGRGIKGFIIAALILYFSQFAVPSMRVTLLGALLGALVIGIIDAIFPTKTL